MRISPILFATLSLSLAAHSAVIHESFGDSDASLVGNTSGTGLTGNWLGDSRPDVVTSTLSYGSLQTTGNEVRADGSWFANRVAIDMTNTAYTDMLADGGEMWFSMIYRQESGSGRFYFTIGDGTVANNGNLSDPGQAIGFGSTGTRVYAGLWETFDWGATNLGGPAFTSVDVSGDSLVNSNDGGVIASATTYLIVGHAQWGADGAANDIVTLYMPDTDMNIGTAVARSEGVLDQSDFSLINTNHGNGVVSRWDEIRIGDSYASVTPVPEPSAALLSGLGVMMLLRRRKR